MTGLGISFATQTITLVVPTMVNDRGRQVPNWAAPPAEEITVRGCVVQPGAGPEAMAERDSVIVRWTVYAPPVPVTAYMGVRYDGVLYQIDGTPARWPSPTGALDHVVLQLIDWEG